MTRYHVTIGDPERRREREDALLGWAVLIGLAVLIGMAARLLSQALFGWPP